MRIETLIFRGQNGFFHQIRHFGDRHDGPALLPELTQQVPFRRDDPQRDLGLVVGQGLERRQGGIKECQYEAPEEAPDHRQPKQDGAEIEEPAF